MKKLLSVILLSLLAANMSVQVFGEETGHGDLGAPSEWAREEIGYAEAMGMLDDLKAPWTGDITREEFCTITYNMINFVLLPEWEKASAFSDTQNKKIAGLYALGVISGRGNGIFDPGGRITREEAATVLYNALKVLDADIDIPTDDIMFADHEDIEAWAMKNVYKMRKLGIMEGTDTGFEPKANITVEQAVCTLRRLYNVSEFLKAEDDSFSKKLNSLMPKDKNYMFSPFSVKLALLMAANGADGETQTQITEALGIYDIEAYNSSVKELISLYDQSELLKIDISNSAWINKDKTDIEFSKEYKDKIEGTFGATFGTVTDESASDTINGWVSDKTNGKITEILDEGNSDFWAMLINAVYFKARWEKEFSDLATKPDDFTNGDGTVSQIDFMNRTGWINYASEAGVEMVELPYKQREDIYDENGSYVETKRIDGIDVSMFLVMSDAEISPEICIDRIAAEPKYLELSVPKFNIEYSGHIGKMLMELGIKKAFMPEGAEFGAMFDNGNMNITDVLHKTYIKVDEEGTEAAAVTSMALAGGSLPPEPTVMKFNKPFYFVIRDNVSGETLFVGKYAFAN